MTKQLYSLLLIKISKNLRFVLVKITFRPVHASYGKL